MCVCQNIFILANKPTLFIQFLTHFVGMQATQKINPKDRRKQIIKQHNEKKPLDKNMVSEYQVDKEVGNGVSSTVFSAININTGEKVAIKKIKNFLENKHESLRILREILLLRQLKHPNIINMKEIVIDGNDIKNLSLILEYLPSDIKKIFKTNRIITMNNVKRIIYQILLGLQYLQQCNVLHRDLKPQNVLVTEDLTTVKLCDFGLARAVLLEEEKEENQDENEMKPEEVKREGNIHMIPKVTLTAHVATRWYRAPELIILERKYSNAIDIWAVGCIMGELMTMSEPFTQRKPLFPGKACYPLSPPKTPDMHYQRINDFPHSVYDQLSLIFSIIGTPKDIDFITDERAKHYIKSFGYRQRKPFKELFKSLSPEADDFLRRSLEFNPNKRMTISEALNHPLFQDVKKDYEKNQLIKGEPINMQLEGIEIQEIKNLVLNELKYYQENKMKE